MGRARADLPAGEGNAAGRRRPGAADGQPARSGSRLIGGGLQVEVTRERSPRAAGRGLLPARARWTPSRAGRQFGLSGVRPALRRRPGGDALPGRLPLGPSPRGHGRRRDAAGGHDPARPDIVLFNGGLFESPVLRQRLLDVLAGWFARPASRWEPLVLDNDRLDLAVARGAAYYGMVRRGQGVRIAAGWPARYYIGVESDEPPAGRLPGAGRRRAGPATSI